MQTWVGSTLLMYKELVALASVGFNCITDTLASGAGIV